MSPELLVKWIILRNTVALYLFYWLEHLYYLVIGWLVCGSQLVSQRNPYESIAISLKSAAISLKSAAISLKAAAISLKSTAISLKSAAISLKSAAISLKSAAIS